ncbi:MAG TPA: beta-ketoacyl-ACP synthase II [Actinomycetes bacterium]|nr:beta-ketoacyl-ACP synthase II [Actinomycetes bacterium]
MRRVVVTGLGAVTPVGVGVKAYWDGITAGRSGVGPLTLLDPEPIPSKVAGECVDFDPSVALGAKQARRLDRSTQFALTAAQEAWQDSEIDGKVDKDETGVVFATGIGGISSLLASEKVLRAKGPDRVSAFTVPQLMPNAAAGQVAMAFRLRGPNFCTTTACAASNHAIGLAFQAIQHGEAEAMVAGGSESAFVDIALVAFAQMTALSTRFNDRPQEASRPFDSLRDGFVMGEGAGALILEEREHALRRGASIHAELIGFGQSADAFHITAPSKDGAGAALAMVRALRSAAVDPSDIGYINAHATSTPTGDISEVRAIRLAFGDHADRLPVSATKSMIGHLFGAAGAVEGIATVLALRDGILPPTINLTHPDPACDLDLIPEHARKADVEVAMSNGFGFGGHNAVLVFRRHDD